MLSRLVTTFIVLQSVCYGLDRDGCNPAPSYFSVYDPVYMTSATNVMDASGNIARDDLHCVRIDPVTAFKGATYSVDYNDDSVQHKSIMYAGKGSHNLDAAMAASTYTITAWCKVESTVDTVNPRNIFTLDTIGPYSRKISMDLVGSGTVKYPRHYQYYTVGVASGAGDSTAPECPISSMLGKWCFMAATVRNDVDYYTGGDPDTHDYKTSVVVYVIKDGVMYTQTTIRDTPVATDASVLVIGSFLENTADAVARLTTNETNYQRNQFPGEIGGVNIYPLGYDKVGIELIYLAEKARYGL